MTRARALCSALAAGLVAGSTLVALQPGGAGDARERAWRENNIGVARLEQYDYRAAAAQFRRALDADPQLAAARFNLALALLYDSQPEEAQREAGAAAGAMPSTPGIIQSTIAISGGWPDEIASHASVPSVATVTSMFQGLSALIKIARVTGSSSAISARIRMGGAMMMPG